MELNVWTSSTVTSAGKDASGAWIVNLTRVLPGGKETTRVLRPTHLVFALGWGAGTWNIPEFPKQVLSSSFPCDISTELILYGPQKEFEGELIHSLQYTTAKKYAGKKVVVIGACTSGHDISLDLASHGVGQ